MTGLAHRMICLGWLLALALMPWSAGACAVCFGNSDSDLAKGMKLGVLTLLLIVVGVLSGFACLFIFMARRAAAAAREEELNSAIASGSE